MGQIQIPSKSDILLSDVDRLTASNAAAGMSPGASHVIALGQDAAQNLTGVADDFIALGFGAGAGSGSQHVIALGQSAASGMGPAAANVIALGVGGAANLNAQNVIAIGAGAVNSGQLQNSAAPCIVLGPNSLTGSQGIIRRVTDGQIVIGGNTLPVMWNRTDSLIAIGSNIGPEWAGPNNFQGNVLNDLLIGHRIWFNTRRAATPVTQWNAEGADNLIIGNGANRFAGWDGSPITDHAALCIGHNTNTQAAQTFHTGIGIASDSVIIGHGAGISRGANTASVRRVVASVVIGNAATVLPLPSTPNDVQRVIYINPAGPSTLEARNSIVLATVPSVTGGMPSGNFNVFLGAHAYGLSASDSTNGSIILGSNVNLGVIPSGLFFVGGAAGTAGMFWGNLLTGNLVVGNSTAAQRDTEVMNQINTLKIIDGMRGAPTPVGGGYLYVNNTDADRLLRFVSSNGAEYRITPPPGMLAASPWLASYADGAGGDTGTLTNAPAAGNPTKWIPIDDNGTTRHIPAW